MNRSNTSGFALKLCSTVDSFIENVSRISEADTYSDRHSSTGFLNIGNGDEQIVDGNSGNRRGQGAVSRP